MAHWEFYTLEDCEKLGVEGNDIVLETGAISEIRKSPQD